MLKLILFGVVLHLFFLASMFVIYFESPIISGLQPQKKILDPPARRLVLFSADGLRAESFFRDGCSNTKFLQNIILTKGIHGISHTRVPTESRTGHIALIAGMYEDPSALFTGWQENIVNFDSVFNRSETTFAWGSPDILKIFEMKSNNRNVRTFAYDKSLQDFSGRNSTIVVDTWVFDNVERFVTARREQLQSENETVYFLHLLGLDTAGHTHKPNTKLFIDNLIAVDGGIERITKLFDEVFQDSRTAFIVTADHGMTDRGSHGDGDDYETQTPIVAWGAGVRKQIEMVASPDRLFSIVGSVKVPRFDIKQIDVVPLMATLLGIPIPVNSYGQLPIAYLNTSKSYTATAMFRNALQIAEQYKHLRNEFRKGSFSKYMNDFDAFDDSHMASMEIQIHKLIDAGNYDEAVILSKRLVEQSLNGVEYFQSYYQYWLLSAVALSMIGWIFYLVQAPLRSTGSILNVNLQISRCYSYVAFFGVFLVLLFVYIQNLSMTHALIFCAPFICWLPISYASIWSVVKDVRVLTLILSVESLLWTFFYRPVVSVLLLLLPIYITLSSDDSAKFFSSNKKWILANIILSVFPLLPIVGKSDKNSTEFLVTGIILWSIKVCYSLRQNYTFYKMYHLLTFTAASVTVIVVHFTTGLNVVCQIVSWLCLIMSFILPLLQSTKHRFEAIIDGLSIPYLLLSLSYEPIFLLILSLCLEYFVGMHQKKASQSQDFMLYVMLAFFGTGNLASISSFDPNSVQCFVAVFDINLMTVLVMVKLVIPLLLVICAFTAVYTTYKLSMERVFLAVLVICNMMGINFLFLVTNKGSWMEIGTSISHFVIIETTTVVLCALQILAKLLMETNLNFVRTKQRSSASKFE